MIVKQLRFIQQRPMDPQSISLQQTHAFWNSCARRSSKHFRNYLIDIEAVKIYALEHPEKCSRNKPRLWSLTKPSFNLQHYPPWKREKRRDSEPPTNDREKNLSLAWFRRTRYFGLRLAKFDLFSLHNSSYSGGWDFYMYCQALLAVVRVSRSSRQRCFISAHLLFGPRENPSDFPATSTACRKHRTAKWDDFFQSPSADLGWFELSFINAVRLFRPHVKINNCFFHFVANIKKRARPIIDELKRRTGRNPVITQLAEKQNEHLWCYRFFLLAWFVQRLLILSSCGGDKRSRTLPMLLTI